LKPGKLPGFLFREELNLSLAKLAESHERAVRSVVTGSLGVRTGHIMRVGLLAWALAIIYRKRHHRVCSA
jgi:hypothetical protein